jgi:hypothetical protein
MQIIVGDRPPLVLALLMLSTLAERIFIPTSNKRILVGLG